MNDDRTDVAPITSLDDKRKILALEKRVEALTG